MNSSFVDQIENACAILAELGPQFQMIKNLLHNPEMTDEGKKNLFFSLKEMLSTFDNIKEILKSESSHFQDAPSKIEALENNELYKWAKEAMMTDEAQSHLN